MAPPSGWSFDVQTEPADAIETFWSFPAHDQWLVTGYPVANDYHQPAIRICSIQDYIDINDMAQERVNAIRATLDARPTLPVGSIPFLPIFNAAQLGQAKVAFFDFQGGRGVRFLTQFGQAFWPFHNRGMVYAFIGLTDDNRYLVFALLPVSHFALNIYDNFQPPDDFYDKAETFLRDQVTMLNTQPDDTFQPSLSTLDELMTSIRMDK